MPLSHYTQKTALHWPSEGGRLAAVQLLLKAGANTLEGEI
jgi:ankyrin repeat protein